MLQIAGIWHSFNGLAGTLYPPHGDWHTTNAALVIYAIFDPVQKYCHGFRWIDPWFEEAGILSWDDGVTQEV